MDLATEALTMVSKNAAMKTSLMRLMQNAPPWKNEMRAIACSWPSILHLSARDCHLGINTDQRCSNLLRMSANTIEVSKFGIEIVGAIDVTS